MSSGLIPVNQLDALPLISAAQAAQAGLLEIIGGRAARYFGPADLGINASGVSTVPVGAGFYYYLATPYLDLRGCSTFAFLLRRNVGATITALAGASLQMQWRLGSADAPGVTWIDPTGAFVNDAQAGKATVQIGVTFPATTAGNNQRALITWGGVLQGGFGADVAPGADARLIVSWSTTNPNNGDNTFTAALWAT